MFDLNLQRFAGEKTERATPKRRSEARKEGQIPKSIDLTSAAVLIAILVGLKFLGPDIWRIWEGLFRNDFLAITTKPLTEQQLGSVFYNQLGYVLRTGGPIVGVALLFGLVVSVAQIGPGFWPNLLIPDFGRVGLISGFRRLFSIRSLVEAGKSLVKLAIVGSVVWSVINGMANKVANLASIDVVSLPSVVGGMAFQIGIDISIMMLVLAVLDFFFQRYDFEKSIRMSREEIKQEMKQQEGDPIVKSAIRQRGRRIAMKRMMQEVPKADVVVTNPTHFAIALLYDASRMNAPFVIAKGKDEVAQKIKEIAAGAGVPMVENRPLAQSLYKNVEISQAVPADLYQAVAEILAYVYRLKHRSSRG
jgi:flagellar biosynthesis protein FlhB